MKVKNKEQFSIISFYLKHRIVNTQSQLLWAFWQSSAKKSQEDAIGSTPSDK